MDERLNTLTNADIEKKLALFPQLLSQGEIGINYLIKSLSDRELAIRVKAYELLQNISSQQVQQAIAPGVLLNPGDRVYSVYRSGIWFTDEVYLLYDERYIEDVDDLRYQIYGERSDDEEEQRIKCQRIYCYVEKKLAETKAEALHREMLQKAGIGIGGFEWRKENSEFDAKKWCLENNIPYPNLEQRNIYVGDYQIVWQIKEFIWEVGNESLEDNLRRSRYIYHPKHIDTWCNDNQINYDPNLDNWDNYRKVLDYLYLPENIDLLSKFWKDGVGNFSFVREEIVQEQISVKPEGSLIDLSQEENSKLQLSLKPENYPELASKFLIDIIESDRAYPQQKIKARQLLQNISWEDLPF